MSAELEKLKEIKTTLDAALAAQKKELEEAKEKLCKLAETDASRQKELDGVLAAIKRFDAMQDALEQYTKQKGDLSREKYFDRDPEYHGLFPSDKMAADFGMFVKAIATKSEIDAKGFVDKGYRFRNTKGQWLNRDDAVKAMMIGSTTGGETLVADQFVPILIRNVERFGTTRKYLRKVPMSQNTQSWPKRTGGFTLYHPDEGVAPTSSDLTLGKIALTARTWAALTFFSKELEEDSLIALGELVMLEFSLTFAMGEDKYTFMGDGSAAMGTVTGVLESANVAVVVMPDGDVSMDDLTYQNLVDLRRAVPKFVREAPDVGFYCSPDIAGRMEKIVDGNGHPMFTHAREGGEAKVLGDPVREINAMPGTAEDAVATKFIAYGSLGLWGMLAERRSFAVESNSNVEWLKSLIAVMASSRRTIEEADGNAMAALQTAAA